MVKNLEKEIKDIKLRNKRVEADKAWETSWSRNIERRFIQQCTDTDGI